MEEGFEVVNLSASGVIPTPNIRTNGNWFVGNKDTGVAAKGETGAQGPQGEKGEKGDQGIQGIQGEKGEKGTDADTSELERLSNEVNTINRKLPWIVHGYYDITTSAYYHNEYIATTDTGTVINAIFAQNGISNTTSHAVISDGANLTTDGTVLAKVEIVNQGSITLCGNVTGTYRMHFTLICTKNY